MAKKKLSKKKRRRRLIRRLILLTLLLAFVTTLAIFSPKIVKIIKLAQEAKELVNKSSLDTFMASGTTDRKSTRRDVTGVQTCALPIWHQEQQLYTILMATSCVPCVSQRICITLI